MPRIDVHTFYADCLKQHGATAEGLHYQSASTQQARFNVLSELLPEAVTTMTLVDVGCGFGDFHQFLQQHGRAPRRYVGIDLHEHMVEVARERTGAEILLGDVLTDPLPAADLYLCSGAMNTLTRDETRQFIRRCYQAARIGYIFNLLHGNDRSETFNYRQPAEIEAWAEELGARCRIIDGYLHQDFTAALMRPDAV
ncbi:class I SAM-dependent methyltransferase [Thiohalocapsa marina]|uniref:Class I SAM-dependent methyltransferase n=1 Tax=Thiohalocapsa marina TaxID=424902 RepID=A0A5M8FJS6_9GAMM|nr:class I SAM-dependent methyltransferase [Thiohalocapsa marina]KAA6185163.1 class I SAM-dependent methyltransferase [Thiohalocapsa marina]